MHVKTGFINDPIKRFDMPLAYNGFGPAAILIMLLCVIISAGFKRLKQRKTVR
jgi:hypothetical protein